MKHFRTLFLALCLPFVATACASDIVGTPDVVESLELAAASDVLPLGQSMQLTAVAHDAHGRIVDGTIEWASANEHIVSVSDVGLVTAVATGGPIEIVARSGSERASVSIRVPPTYAMSPTVASMLERISTVIDAEARYQRDLLPLNPRTRDYIEAKIALLDRPTLPSEIIDGRHFSEDSTHSRDGRTIPIVSVYPLARMHVEAEGATRQLSEALPLLEAFFGAPFPYDMVNVWQGFSTGARGGGGMMMIVDRSTFQSIPPPPGLPFVMRWEATVFHELAHSFIRNEGLTQFLELYTCNVLQTHSTDVADWTFTRGYAPLRDTNTEIHALLDIYVLIGAEAMSRAYAAVLPLHPNYGAPLSPPVRQAFIDAAPSEHRQAVAAKIATITF